MSFKRFDPEDLVVSSDKVVLPAWTGNKSILITPYTSSLQKNSDSGRYFLDVYNTDPAVDTSSEVQFSIAYGHKDGSGSIPYNSLVPGKSPSSTVYGQYRNLLLGNEEADFTFGSGSVTSSLGVAFISLNRGRFKERLKVESFGLTVDLTGSVVTLAPIPSLDTVAYSDAGRVYKLYRGTGDSYADQWGKLYPDVGIAVLNLSAISGSGIWSWDPGIITGSMVYTGSVEDRINTEIIYKHIYGFSAQSEETISSNYMFVRARNKEFNHTMNPSLLDETGNIQHTDLVDNPRTYITTVGLYNDSNDLLAVAKLSSPLQKDFTKETLLRVKLDY